MGRVPPADAGKGRWQGGQRNETICPAFAMMVMQVNGEEIAPTCAMLYERDGIGYPPSW